ncbi:MAG: T9SS type A sorting domain-containing protein [Bacteroidales bacterium]|nr:T9SS type A sorting domain-containing protein [Bacteroidales bacterium]
MKKSFLVLYLLFATISFASAQSMDWQYATRFGGSNKFVNQILTPLNYPHHLELDAEGNAYIFGTYGDNASFYGYPDDELQFNTPIYGDHCAGTFVAKFDCNGNVVWHKAIARETNRSHSAQYMVLKNNRLYLQGTVHMPTYECSLWFLDTLVYGSNLVYYATSEPDRLTFPWFPNNFYTYIMELDLDGNIVDYNLFSLYREDIVGNHKLLSYIFPSGVDDYVPFAIDNQHNYYMLSNMRSEGMTDSLGNRTLQKMLIKLNGEDITDTIMPEDNQYVYHMLKFDQDFNLQYDKSIIECIHAPYYSIDMHFYDMKCDSNDNIYLCGSAFVRDTASISHYPYDVELADGKHIYVYTPQGPEGFIIKMNSDGEILWVSQTRNHGDDYAESRFESMYLDEDLGNIYISDYSFPKSSTFPNNYTIFGENDTLVNNCDGIFMSYTNVIVCYDTAGNYKWYNCPITTKCEIGSIAKHNDKLYAGVCWSAYGLVCGENTYMPSEQLQGSGTPYRGFSICEWDLQGNMTDVIQVYSKAQLQTMPYDTRINSLGEIYTVGRFDNRMAFGEDTIIDNWDSDMFIAKFGLPCPTYIYDTVTYCYGEVVQGVTLTASGDYTFAYPEGGQEFDSIVLVHATVLPPLTIGLNDTTVCTAQQFYLDACGEFDSYQWSTGGTGCTEMLQFDNACTQSVTLTVTRGECSASKTISITAQVCDGITEPTATAMSLYPNPASDMVTIFGDGFVSATVIDINGRIVLQTTAMQLDISGLRPGEYVVKVERLNGETEELKMVKE